MRVSVGGAMPAVIASSVPGIVLLVAAMFVAQLPWPPVAKLTAAPGSAWLGFETRHITVWRVVGCGLMLSGLFSIWKF